MKELLNKISSKFNNPEIIEEAIPLSMAKQWMKKLQDLGVNHKTRYQNLFGNDEMGRPRMRIYFPLSSGTPLKDMQPHPKIKKALEENGYKIENYAGQMAIKPNGQQMRIGPALTNIFKAAQKSGNEEKIREYSILERLWKSEGEEMARKAKLEKDSSGQDYVVISRHPYDIMGTSGDRDWASCQSTIDRYESPGKEARPQKEIERINKQSGEKLDKSKHQKVKTKVSDFAPERCDPQTGQFVKNFIHTKHGMYYLGVQGDLLYGSIIAYVIRHDDLNINNPKGRLLIKPFYRSDGQVFLVPDPKIYTAGENSATAIPGFKSTIQKWLNQHQSEAKGIYTIKQFAEQPELQHGKKSWHGHYRDAHQSDEVTANEYKDNFKNVKEFRDGLTWEGVIDFYSDFAMSKFEDAIIGERNGKIIFYGGRYKEGLFNGNMVGGVFEDGTFDGGTMESPAEWEDGSVVTGTFKNVEIENMNVGIKVKLIKCTVKGNLKLNGGGLIDDTYIERLTFGDITHASVLKLLGDYKIIHLADLESDKLEIIFGEKGTVENGIIRGTFKDRTISNNLPYSVKCKFENCKFVGGVEINESMITGGELIRGTLKKCEISGTPTSRFLVKGGTIINSTLNNTVVQKGSLKNCIFNSGKFLRGNFWHGTFAGGTFAGGNFIDGKFGKDAKWVGGVWQGGEGKPENAKESYFEIDKKKESKIHKELDLKTRLQKKEQTPE